MPYPLVVMMIRKLFDLQHISQTSLFALLVLSMAGCQSIHHGSPEKRAQVLSRGIQGAYGVSSSTAERVSPYIIQSADRHDISPALIAALIRQESTYRSNVVSPAGAVGLTQVIPRFWQQKCPGNLYDESTNIACGSYILAHYQQRAGSEKKALAYYNVGPSGYENNRKMRKQGQKYAKQVKAHEKALKKKI